MNLSWLNRALACSRVFLQAQTLGPEVHGCREHALEGCLRRRGCGRRCARSRAGAEGTSLDALQAAQAFLAAGAVLTVRAAEGLAIPQGLRRVHLGRQLSVCAREQGGGDEHEMESCRFAAKWWLLAMQTHRLAPLASGGGEPGTTAPPVPPPGPSPGPAAARPQFNPSQAREKRGAELT